MANKHKIGLIFGSFLGLWHVLWSLLVALGLAQPLLDWIFWLHMIDNPMHVQAFSLTRFLLLIVVVSAVGYIGGYVMASLWNYFHKA